MDNLISHIIAASGPTTENRPLQLALAFPEGTSVDTLLPQRLHGSESICGGFEYRVLCVSDNATLPLKDFIAVPAEVRIVTDRGQLRRICGIVTQAEAGQSDGALASYLLVLRDALSIMERRVNTRVFRNMNELTIISTLVAEWRQQNATLREYFDLHIDAALSHRELPVRAFTMQHNESDAALIRRLLKRRGIPWYCEPGLPDRSGAREQGGTAAHTLVLFDDPLRLRENAAGTVRYHRDNATEQRDTITAWQAVRTLQPGSTARHSWDYGTPTATTFMHTVAKSQSDQGISGNRLAATLDDYFVGAPHIGNDATDLTTLGNLYMARHDYATKCFRGEGSVRDLAVGEWIGLADHPEIDTHPAPERQFVITSQQIETSNNLPLDLRGRVERLFSRSGWIGHDTAEREVPRYRTRFDCVRRGIPIVPLFDPSLDLPRPQLQSAVVVGPASEEYWCDEKGRVNVRYTGTRSADHEHSAGAGSSNSDADSAWVRVCSGWAGNGPGSQQCGTRFLPPIGTEVLIDFLGGDPDKPVIIGQLYNSAALPPTFRHEDGLPDNKYQFGIRTREVRGQRGNQLRLDDTPGQIGAQLASDHANSELNLGFLTEPRRKGAGAPRGEGAELHSDEHIALRAARGLLLTAWKRAGGTRNGRQLARTEFLDLLKDCAALSDSLGKYAATHQALETDGKERDDLYAQFRSWENGSNTAPEAPERAEPVIGITAPAGIGFATSKAIVSYAASNIDTVAQQNLQLTSGQRFNVNAGRGLSLFAHHDGLMAIAHQGKLLLQSQHDDMVLNAAKNLTLTSSEGKLTAMAKVIELIAEDGSFVKIGDGTITFGSKSPLKFLAPDFSFDAPSTMAAQLPTFEGAPVDQQFLLRYPEGAQGDEPAEPTLVPGAPVKIAVSDDSSIDGRSDDAGKSATIARDAMHMADISVMSSVDKA